MMSINKRKILDIINSILIVFMLSLCLFFTTLILWAKSIWEDLDFSQIMPNLQTNVPITDVFEFSPQLVYYIIVSVLVFFIVFGLLNNKQIFIFNLFLVCVFVFNIGIIPYYYNRGRTTTIYEDYYVNPDLDNIKFPDKKRNLMIIYMESIEDNFSNEEYYSDNLLPNLSKIRDENISFSNHVNMYGTGYSLASLVSSHCGIPFNPNPKNIFEKNNLLNNITCISDVLDGKGYENWFIKGANVDFADTNLFLARHAYKNIIDKNILTKNMTRDEIKENISSFEGIRDEVLFNYIKNIFEEGAVSAPFLFTIFTVDSHIPGTKSPKNCEIKYNDIRDNIICTDKNVTNFLEYFKTTEYYKDTTIVLMGDHLMPNSPKYEKAPKKRRIFNTFLNLPKKFNVLDKQAFSTIDFAPTFLESIGVNLKDNAFGLGRSLLSTTPTLISDNEVKLAKNVKYNSKVYDSFSQGVKQERKETSYQLGEIINNIDIPKYSSSFAKAVNTFYAGDVGLKLENMPNNDMKLELTFSAMRGYDPKLSVTLNGELLEVVGYSKTEKLPKTITINVPKTLINTSKLLFEFSNNNYMSTVSQSIDITGFKLYEE